MTELRIVQWFVTNVNGQDHLTRYTIQQKVQGQWTELPVVLQEETDIVERLRDHATRNCCSTRLEAADEIERLRKVIDSISRMTVRPHGLSNRFALTTAIDMARAALGKGKDD